MGQTAKSHYQYFTEGRKHVAGSITKVRRMDFGVKLI